MGKSLADNGFITEMKDKNGDSWYHQIVLEAKKQEIERLHSIIKEVREEIQEADDDITLNLSVNYIHKAFKKDLLEILDKVDKENKE